MTELCISLCISLAAAFLQALKQPRYAMQAPVAGAAAPVDDVPQRVRKTARHKSNHATAADPGPSAKETGSVDTTLQHHDQSIVPAADLSDRASLPNGHFDQKRLATVTEADAPSAVQGTAKHKHRHTHKHKQPDKHEHTLQV